MSMPKKDREKLIFFCCLCVIYVKYDKQYGQTVKSVVNITTRDSEHITMWNVPVCESQCVLCRPWKSV